MALVACPECQHQVSDTAFKCTQCGVHLRKPRRSLFGKLCKWSFILFNVLMVVWLVGYLGLISETMDTATSEAEQAGTAIGATLGVGMLVMLWALGDVILGLFVLFTRPKA